MSRQFRFVFVQYLEIFARFLEKLVQYRVDGIAKKQKNRRYAEAAAADHMHYQQNTEF